MSEDTTAADEAINELLRVLGELITHVERTTIANNAALTAAASEIGAAKNHLLMLESRVDHQQDRIERLEKIIDTWTGEP